MPSARENQHLGMTVCGQSPQELKWLVDEQYSGDYSAAVSPPNVSE
jgi:hypothetical protein